jgi:hypothetical protein
MRTKKISFLMENGLPSKFLINLSDKQVDNLYKKYLEEQPQPIVKTKTVKQIEVPTGSETSVGGISVANKAGKTVVTTTAEGEMKEDDTVEKDPFQTTSTQDKRQVGPSDYGNNPTKDSEMDSDDADGMDILENKKKSKYNPWAVCTSQMGKEFGTTERSDWSKPQMAKYERCVKDVKKSIKEGKDPYESLLESHIIKLVNKHVNENMQLVSFKKLDKPVGKMYTSKKSNPMEAAEPAVKPRTAPPKTKPGVKPSKPNPYQPPKETPKEKPRAQDYKSMFISALNQLLGK